MQICQILGISGFFFHFELLRLGKLLLLALDKLDFR